MNGPSLQRLAVLSIVFHLTFFLAVFFAAKQSNRFVMPSPYVVSLVGSDVKTEGKSDTRAVTQTQSPAVTKEVKSAPEKAKTVSKAEEKDVSDQIAALKAKKDIERIVKLRNVISLKGSSEGKPASQGPAGKGGDSLIDNYYAKIINDIHKNWQWPSAMTDKDLEAIVSIRILRTGL